MFYNSNASVDFHQISYQIYLNVIADAYKGLIRSDNYLKNIFQKSSYSKIKTFPHIFTIEYQASLNVSHFLYKVLKKIIILHLNYNQNVNISEDSRSHKIWKLIDFSRIPVQKWKYENRVCLRSEWSKYVKYWPEPYVNYNTTSEFNAIIIMYF